MERWDTSWRAVFDALTPLTATDLGRTITIRGEAYTVLQAILRHARHCAYHVGQIVQLAKHHAGAEWKTLSVARAQPRRYNDTARP